MKKLVTHLGQQDIFVEGHHTYNIAGRGRQVVSKDPSNADDTRRMDTASHKLSCLVEWVDHDPDPVVITKKDFNQKAAVWTGETSTGLEFHIAISSSTSTISFADKDRVVETLVKVVYDVVDGWFIISMFDHGKQVPMLSPLGYNIVEKIIESTIGPNSKTFNW